jgi:hypothetical protein
MMRGKDIKLSIYIMISQIMDKAVQHGKNTNSVGVLVFFSPSR